MIDMDNNLKSNYKFALESKRGHVVGWPWCLCSTRRGQLQANPESMNTILLMLGKKGQQLSNL